MKRTTKTDALYMIWQMGRIEERQLRNAGKHHEAFQIEHARLMLHYALLDGVKAVRERLVLMTTLRVEGVDHNTFYVTDDYARSLVEGLRRIMGEVTGE